MEDVPLDRAYRNQFMHDISSSFMLSIVALNRISRTGILSIIACFAHMPSNLISKHGATLSHQQQTCRE
jgi:hypothetical protein